MIRGSSPDLIIMQSTNGTLAASDLQVVLREIFFEHTPTRPETSFYSALVTVTASDGELESAASTVIQVSVVNQGPEVQLDIEVCKGERHAVWFNVHAHILCVELCKSQRCLSYNVSMSYSATQTLEMVDGEPEIALSVGPSILEDSSIIHSVTVSLTNPQDEESESLTVNDTAIPSSISYEFVSSFRIRVIPVNIYVLYCPTEWQVHGDPTGSCEQCYI